MNATAIYRALGANLCSRREELSLTQAEVAKRIGLSRASLANIEAGRQTVALHQAYALADALNLTVGELLPPHDTLTGKSAAEPLGLPFLRDDLSAAQRTQIESAMSAAMASASAKREE